jgi:inosose dehydratase
MDRRAFLAASGLAGSAVWASNPRAAQSVPPADKEQACSTAQGPRALQAVPQQEQYRIGYTTNTRGGWEGDPFKGMSEAREMGFRYMEIFGTSFCRPDSRYYPDGAESLMRRIFQIGVNFAAITGGSAGGNTRFEDPTSREAVIEDHVSMAHFSRRFGCVHQKINLGKRRPEGTTDEDLKCMSQTAEALGKRINEDLGMRFGVHPHLGSQLQNEHEVTYLMENTDPQYVGLVLDTGHITMAGMDPLALAKLLGHRVVEYHLKDTAAKDRGGTKNVPGPEVDQMKEPYFFPLGSGGVDFVGLKRYLDSIQWRGFLTVELDTSPWRPPQQSAAITADYIRNILKIPF